MTSKVDCVATQLVAQNRGLGLSSDISSDIELRAKMEETHYLCRKYYTMSSLCRANSRKQPAILLVPLRTVACNATVLWPFGKVPDGSH